jgi:hypothetical protein
MRDKSQKACQFVSLLIRFACVAILFLATSAIPMTNQAQTQQQSKPPDSVPIPEPAIAAIHGQTRSPSFQYVATAGGELRGLSTPYTAHPGSRQFVYFSNDKLTIAAAIEVEDIRGGVALLSARTKSYPGTVDRETSERELKSALPREYTYVPMEKLILAVDGGGVLSLEGAIADKSGNLSEPIAPLPARPGAGQTVRVSPALLRGDRVNGVPQKLGSIGTFQTLLVLHLANGFVLLICFFSLGIKNPWKWFQQTRMKNMK